MLYQNSVIKKNAVVTPAASSMAALLLESDRLYFEAGAQLETLPAGVIAVMPNLSHIPAGCVTHRITSFKGTDQWNTWVEGLEQRLKGLGCLRPRLYLDQPIPELTKTLLQRGYSPQVEVGLLDENLTASKLKMDLAVSLRPVIYNNDWQQKLWLHSEKENGPDGHATLPQDWVELERRKCATGAMHVFLICIGDEVCGTVGALEVGPLLRLKNLLVHPDWRRRGIAQATVYALRNRAIYLEKRAFGCFALLNGAGQRVYERAGLSVVTQQTEWYSP